MPAVSKSQQRFMGVQLAKKRAGQKTDVKMSEKQLKDFAGTKLKGLPGHVGKGQDAPKDRWATDEEGRDQAVRERLRKMKPELPTPDRPRELEQKRLGVGQATPPDPTRSTYGPYDPPGYGAGQGQPMTPPPTPTAAPSSDGQVPGQGMPVDPIDQQIQQLLLQKQAQLQQRMQPGPPQAPPQGGVGGGMPGMGQGMAPNPRLSPPPIGTGLQTMPSQGMPLQDPAISPSGGGGGGLAALLGGPPPISKPPLPGSPPPLQGRSNPAKGKPPIAKSAAKTSMKKGSAPAKKVRGKNRPAAGGRGERKGKTGIGQAGAASCAEPDRDDKKVGMGQAAGPGMAPAANNPYVMVKGRPYEQMPNGSLMPMISPNTKQEAQVPQQAQATPMGPPPQQGGVAPIGSPPAGGMPPSPPGRGQGDPSVGDQLGGAPSAGRAGVTLGAPRPEYPQAPAWHYGFRADPRVPDPTHLQGDRTDPSAYNPGTGYRDFGGVIPQGYRDARKQSLGMIGQGQSAPDPAAAARAASPNTHITNNGGGVSMIGSRPAGLPGSVGGAGGFGTPAVPPVPPVGTGQSSKKSKPPVMKKSKGGY